MRIEKTALVLALRGRFFSFFSRVFSRSQGVFSLVSHAFLTE